MNLKGLEAWLDMGDFYRTRKNLLGLAEGKKRKAILRATQANFKSEAKRDAFIQMVNKELNTIQQFVEETEAYLATCLDLLEQRETHIMLLNRENRKLENKIIQQGNYPISVHYKRSLDEQRAAQTEQYRKWADFH